MNQIALSLGEAVIGLYPSNSAGQALLDSPVWCGAVAHDLSISKRFNKQEYWPTGAEYPERRHEGTGFDIEIGRAWFLPVATKEDFDPNPNQKFVMIIVWHDARTNIWHRRTFYRAMCDDWNVKSNDMVESVFNQKFTADYDQRDSGEDVIYSLPSPPSPVPTPGEEAYESFLFMHEGPMRVNDYMLGHYSWGYNITIDSVEVISRAPQGTNLVLALEVNGTLTGDTVTISAGVEHAEATASSSSMGVSVSTGDVVRWRATSGPTVTESCAYEVGLVMKITV